MEERAKKFKYITSYSNMFPLGADKEKGRMFGVLEKEKKSDFVWPQMSGMEGWQKNKAGVQVWPIWSRW